MDDRSWFQKNKKWFLPTVILGPILFVGGFMLLIFSFVMGMMTSSGAYKMTMDALRTNEECVSFLGDSIEVGYFIRGSISTTNNSGNANLYIPLKGNLNEGTAHTVCIKEWGKWRIVDLEVKINEKIIEIK